MVKMALKNLKRPKIEVEAKATPNLFEALASLSEDEQMDFEERAGIMEYDGGLSRAEAERGALEIILKERGDLS